MARTINWNARGNLVLTAAQRAQAANLANIRGERSYQTDTVPPTTIQLYIDGNVIRSGDEVLGTLVGTPDIG